MTHTGVDLAKELLGVCSHLGPAHWRQGPHEVPSIGGGGETGVEDRDDPTVVRAAHESPRPLGKQVGRPREVDESKRLGSSPFPSRHCEGMIGSGEGDAVDDDKGE